MLFCWFLLYIWCVLFLFYSNRLVHQIFLVGGGMALFARDEHLFSTGMACFSRFYILYMLSGGQHRLLPPFALALFLCTRAGIFVFIFASCCMYILYNGRTNVVSSVDSLSCTPPMPFAFCLLCALSIFCWRFIFLYIFSRSLNRSTLLQPAAVLLFCRAEH